MDQTRRKLIALSSDDDTASDLARYDGGSGNSSRGGPPLPYPLAPPSHPQPTGYQDVPPAFQSPLPTPISLGLLPPRASISPPEPLYPVPFSGSGSGLPYPLIPPQLSASADVGWHGYPSSQRPEPEPPLRPAQPPPRPPPIVPPQGIQTSPSPTSTVPLSPKKGKKKKRRHQSKESAETTSASASTTAAAAATTASPGDPEMERQLSCSVCIDLYTEPLLLPCLHSLCRKCVEALCRHGDGTSFKCPECNKPVKLSKKGIRSLQKNFTLEGIVELYRKSLTSSRQVVQGEAGSGSRCEQTTASRPRVTSSSRDQVTSSSNQSAECVICSSVGSVRCGQCQMTFCDKCLQDYHPTTETTPHHTLIPLTDSTYTPDLPGMVDRLS